MLDEVPDKALPFSQRAVDANLGQAASSREEAPDSV